MTFIPKPDRGAETCRKIVVLLSKVEQRVASVIFCFLLLLLNETTLIKEFVITCVRGCVCPTFDCLRCACVASVLRVL